MRCLRIEDAATGQKLAQNVTDAGGNLLVPAGIVLNAEMLARLRGRQVTAVWVEGDGPGSAGLPTSGEAEQRLQKIDADLDALFADTRRHPVMAAICEAAKTVLRAKAGRKPEGPPSQVPGPKSGNPAP